MDQDRPPPRRASNRSCVAHRRADLPETGLRSSQRVLARTTDVSASSLPEATLPTMQASLQSTLHAPTIFESWLPMDSDIFRKGNCNARPRHPILATMAATVPIVGNRRENPSVYLRPIAQAISQRPATSRKSQAMGDPP